MAGKALCQDPSKAAGKIKRKKKSLPKRRLFSMEWFSTGRGALAFVPRRSCLPLTREVASPKGLTEGEIGRAYGEAGCAEEAGCKFSPSVACGDSSLVRGSQGLGCACGQARQREPRGLCARRRGPERASGRPPAFTARTWPPGAPPNNPGCASGWCCRPPE